MQPVVIEISPRPDNTVPAQIDHFRANPMTLRVLASADWPIAGADSLNVEIRQSPTDTADPFALSTLANPAEADSWDLPLLSAEWNQTTGTKSYRNYWLVAYIISGEERQDLWTALVRLANANASLTAPAPPNPAVALTESAADLLYASLAMIEALEARIAALEAASGGPLTADSTTLTVDSTIITADRE